MNNSHIWPVTAGLVGGRLQIGGCDIASLAREYGTPLYLFVETTIRGACRGYLAAFAGAFPGEAQVHYASKALLNTAIAQIVAQEGLGLDVVSGGELFLALRAGFPAHRIHLHGNAKPEAELVQALKAGIGQIVVDNLDELALLARLTGEHATPQQIALRLSPDVAPDTHHHIQTGQATSKFGLPLGALDAAAEVVRSAPGIRLAGIHAHLGSQIFDNQPYEEAIRVLLDCAQALRDRYSIQIEEINPGGGLGVPYLPEQQLPDISAYAAAISRAMVEGCAARGFPLLRLAIEPGRSIVARAGVALYTIVGTKKLPGPDGGRWTMDHETAEPRTKNPEPTINDQQRIAAVGNTEYGIRDTNNQPSSTVHRPRSATCFLHIDGGMADNIRPSLYQARYTALLPERADADPAEIVHISGRYCESGDVLLRDLALPSAAPGDLVAVAAAGAYTLSMASNYNLTPRPAVVLVGEGPARLIQRRETYEDLVRRDLFL
jgi:diaminopimelate decarboxylase